MYGVIRLTGKRLKRSKVNIVKFHFSLPISLFCLTLLFRFGYKICESWGRCMNFYRSHVLLTFMLYGSNNILKQLDKKFHFALVIILGVRTENLWMIHSESQILQPPHHCIIFWFMQFIRRCWAEFYMGKTVSALSFQLFHFTVSLNINSCYYICALYCVGTTKKLIKEFHNTQ